MYRYKGRFCKSEWKLARVISQDMEDWARANGTSFRASRHHKVILEPSTRADAYSTILVTGNSHQIQSTWQQKHGWIEVHPFC